MKLLNKPWGIVDRGNHWEARVDFTDGTRIYHEVYAFACEPKLEEIDKKIQTSLVRLAEVAALPPAKQEQPSIASAADVCKELADVVEFAKKDKEIYSRLTAVVGKYSSVSAVAVKEPK